MKGDLVRRQAIEAATVESNRRLLGNQMVMYVDTPEGPLGPVQTVEQARMAALYNLPPGNRFTQWVNNQLGIRGPELVSMEILYKQFHCYVLQNQLFERQNQEMIVLPQEMREVFGRNFIHHCQVLNCLADMLPAPMGP